MTLYNIILLVIIIFFSVLCSYQDLKAMVIYDYPLWAACYAALICHLVFNRQGIWIYILSGMISGGFYYLIRIITKKKLGIGDVYFGFFQGACIPFQYLPICLAIETVVALIVVNKKIGHKAFPFVPFMSVGLLGAYIISLFWKLFV